MTVLSGASLAWAVLAALPEWQLVHRRATLWVSFAAAGAPAALLSLMGCLLLARRPRTRLVALLPLALIGWHLALGWQGPPRSAPDESSGLTVVTLNLQFGKADPATTEAVLAAQQPDILVLEEITVSSLADLQRRGTFAALPHAVGLPGHDYSPTSGSDASGTMIFSRYPLSPLSPHGPASLQTARVERPEGALVVIAAHPANPDNAWDRWLPDHEAVAAEVRAHLGERLLVVGDLNAVTQHAPLQRLARVGVVDAATVAGSWWLPTWPSDRRFPPLLAIDHVLVGPGIVPVSADTFRVPETDHLGLVTRLRLP